MNAYGSYGEFENKLWYLEQDSYGNTITIGILICDATKQNEITNRILTDMKDFDSKSEEFINFYIPGYCSKEQMNSYEYPENYETFYETKWEGYYFSSCLFNDFLAELKTKNIEYKEEPELILVEIVDGQIHWEKRIIFPLLTMEKKGNIKNVKEFFEDIFKDAKKYVRITDFSKQGMRREIKKSIIDYIKAKIPEEIMQICNCYNNCKDFQIRHYK